VLYIASAKSLNVGSSLRIRGTGITCVYVYKADSRIELVHRAKLIASGEAR